ncbi:MAG: hypothetical protein KDD94_11550 [Calditrichaeota bacterium]|nr:hypothetical protein [Calditrichota bacterium]
MRNSKLVVILVIVLLACSKKEAPKDVSEANEMFPAEFTQVLKLHGELDHWKYYHYLRFNKGNEQHTIDLWSRKTKIEAEQYSLGFDGETVWLKQDSTYFSGSPVFYHNLYFYFFAMPFVLADPGTHHETVQPVTLMDKQYHGVRVTFDDGIGASSKDEYIVYFDPETDQMQWLAYMSTFFTKEKKTQYNIIHYEDWQQVRDIWLPAKISWYNYKDGILGEKRNTVEFKNVTLSETEFPDFSFAMPDGSKKINE